MAVKPARPPAGTHTLADSTPGVAPRRAAMTLLHNVTVLARPLDPMLDRGLAGLSGSDRGLARALTSGALRHLAGLDQLIDSATRQTLPADARARQALRIALAGRLLLDTPEHAVIATILPLLEGGPRRLVHGILSTLFRQGAHLPPARLPPYWEQRWGQNWGIAEVEAAARRLAQPPATDLTLKDPAQTHIWADRLGATVLMPGQLRLPDAPPIEQLPGYAEGEWWVQDVAAALPARLLGDVAGKDVLDLCAAPGGKTMQLAALGGRVTALDISASRLKRLRANLERVKLSADIIEADARQWQPAGLFDAILLDAPCSATGTFGRHPDILYVKSSLDLERPLALQRLLLEQAARWLKPGGRLIYAVCSLEPAEGEGQIFPAGLAIDRILPAELPAGLAPDAQGAVRTLPSTWGEAGSADGFFIARLGKGEPAGTTN